MGELTTAEMVAGIPTYLLARIAYEESHFREDIIRGQNASPVGALGMMQLRPRFFKSVCKPTPFTDADVKAQIYEAADFLESLYVALRDWTLAVAGYNAGLGNVEHYGGIPPFPETEKYVAEITADVPLKESA